MPALFGRDISRFPDVIDVWYGSSPMLRKPSKVFPSSCDFTIDAYELSQTAVKILFPLDYLPTSNSKQSALIEKLVVGLESALHTKRIKISLASLWKEDCPDGKEHDNVVDYLETV